MDRARWNASTVSASSPTRASVILPCAAGARSLRSSGHVAAREARRPGDHEHGKMPLVARVVKVGPPCGRGGGRSGPRRARPLREAGRSGRSVPCCRYQFAISAVSEDQTCASRFSRAKQWTWSRASSQATKGAGPAAPEERESDSGGQGQPLHDRGQGPSVASGGARGLPGPGAARGREGRASARASRARTPPARGRRDTPRDAPPPRHGTRADRAPSHVGGDAGPVAGGQRGGVLTPAAGPGPRAAARARDGCATSPSPPAPRGSARSRRR